MTCPVEKKGHTGASGKEFEWWWEDSQVDLTLIPHSLIFVLSLLDWEMGVSGRL